MKILFIYPNIYTIHGQSYHFGLGIIASFIKQHDFDVKVIELRTVNDYQKVDECIRKWKPQVVGFSVVSSQFYHVKKFTKRIKTIDNNCLIVCGGIHPTIYPECLMECNDIDGAFMGESESPFLEFLMKVERGEDFRSVDNFCYMKDGTLVKNRIRERSDKLDIFGIAIRYFFNYQEDVDSANGEAQFSFNRGCPFECTYCSNKAIAQVYGLKHNKCRYKSVDLCLEEIDYVIKNFKNIRKLWIIDDIFALNRIWLKEFCQKYPKRFSYPFMCHIRPGTVNFNTLKLIRDAGCYRVMMGIESGNDWIRNTVMKRNITRKQIVDTYEWAHILSLETLATNVIGVPGETEETVWDTIHLNREVKPTDSAASIFYPYEGSELAELCLKNNLIPSKREEMVYEKKESILNLPTISNERLKYFEKNWTYLVYRGINNKKIIKSRINKVFLSPLLSTPLWRFIKPAYRHYKRLIKSDT